MLTTELTITIPGESVPKGSMKCIGQRGKVRHQLIEDETTRVKEWRGSIAYWVRRKWMSHAAAKGQPLGAEITFTIKRPKSHYGTGRNADQLKPAAIHALPVSHSVGDVDKLLRLILDALQDTHALPDDAAVCELTGRKHYVQHNPTPGDDVLSYPGVVIRLYPLEQP